MKQTRMYVCTFEEFILVDIWIHCLHKVEVLNDHIGKNATLYTLATKDLRNVRIALRSQLTSES